jgi:arginyl-tRNA synthetase
MLILKLQTELLKIAQEHYQLTSQDVELTPTRDLAHGDYTTNAALRVASRWGVPPRQAAEVLLEQLKISKTVNALCSRVEVAGPGFINFWLKHSWLIGHLSEFTNPKDRAVARGQRVLVDYSSPNIAKPMHIGHIRSTIIGQALVNMYQALGAKVVGVNHLGDWGTQFGKLIAAFKLWGNRAALHKQPIEEMLKLYVKFHEVAVEQPELEKNGQEEFRKLEQGDRANRALWNWFKRESLREFNALYKRLGVKFTYITGESFYEPKLKGVVNDLLKRRLAIKNADGSIVVHLESANLPPCLVQKSDGASLYVTRDLATIQYRWQRFKPTKFLYVVANQQALHFEQLFAVASQAGYVGRNAELEHIKFGLVLGEDGQKLATREGRIIKLEDVLAEAVTRAKKIVDNKNPKLSARERAHIAEVVGVGAVKYNDLSQNRHSDIAFNWDKMLSLEGNSAPYLQYTYVRLKSIMRKAGVTKPAVKKVGGEALQQVLTERDINMLRLLSRYPDAISRAVRENGPHLLAGYIYELANAVNSYYHDSPVLNAGAILRPFRLTIVSSAAAVLKEGLGILGIATVEQM